MTSSVLAIAGARLARFLLAACAAICFWFATGSVVQAQIGDSIPSTLYYGTGSTFYQGEYNAALLGYRNALQSGIKNINSRWIDSICYHTMCGECFYHMGQFSLALEQYTAALKLYAAFPDWMLRVQFPLVIAPSGARELTPWGATRRPTRIGQFPNTFLISQGQVNNNAVIQQGGVVQAPMMVQVNVAEIVRATTLAMRRRREIMGPVCKYDPFTGQLVTLLSRRPAPANNWSQAWVDVMLGAAYASAGNISQAVTSLERGMVVHGELDHPLTATALLELGHLALQTGDLASAGRLFEEASYASASFSDPGILEEALRLGQLTHLMTNQKGIYSPLAPALLWSKQQGLAQLHASLAILTAENLALQGETPSAVQAIAEARATINRHAMGAGSIGARLNFVAALVNYQARQTADGDQALAAAMNYMSTGSLWLYHIGLVDTLYESGDIYDRVATLLYDFVLRDPTPADWSATPLESLAVLMHPHPLPYEHWFEATLKRNKEPELAVEIADRARRHRYFSTLPLGGRLLSLRWVLEGPKHLLNEQAELQRQDLLARFPAYQELAVQATKIQSELAKQPLVADDPAARREQAKQLLSLGTISQQQELLLREMAVRHEGAEMIFPPLRKTKDVQQSLPPGHALLAFFVTSSDNVYAFLFTKDKYTMWRVAAPAQLRRHMTSMLRELGNTDQNHALSAQELERDNWKKSAAKIVEVLFEKSSADLSSKFEELIIVPDGVLWYLPFEMLPVGKKDDSKMLLEQVRVRYAPTVGLSIPYTNVRKPTPRPTGLVVGKLYPQSDVSIAADAGGVMERAVEGSVVLPSAPGASSSLYRTLLDGLIVLDDIHLGNNSTPYEWSPAQFDAGKPGSTLAAWMTLPWGGPQYLILPGFHTAAETGLRKGGLGGNEMFLSLCGIMSTGTRTVLVSRWRTGGQSAFDLVREFAQELPHTSAADAWQRSVQLTTEQTLDFEAEPRLKKMPANTPPIKTEHPFFWAAYMVVDSGQGEDNAEPLPPMGNNNAKAPVPAAGDVKEDGRQALAPARDPAVLGGGPGAVPGGAVPPDTLQANPDAGGKGKRGKAKTNPRADRKNKRTAAAEK